VEDIKVYYNDGTEESFKHDGKTLWNKNMEWYQFKCSDLNFAAFINPAEVKKVESTLVMPKEPVEKKPKPNK